MARKGENIHKRKDGRWEGRFKNGYNPDGSAKYSSVYGKTYTETKLKLTKARRNTVDLSKTNNVNIRFSDVLTQRLH